MEQFYILLDDQIGGHGWVIRGLFRDETLAVKAKNVIEISEKYSNLSIKN